MPFFLVVKIGAPKHDPMSTCIQRFCEIHSSHATCIRSVDRKWLASLYNPENQFVLPLEAEESWLLVFEDDFNV